MIEPLLLFSHRRVVLKHLSAVPTITMIGLVEIVELVACVGVYANAMTIALAQGLLEVAQQALSSGNGQHHTA